MKTAQDYLTHDELQHIEHCNKVLETHLELVNSVTALSQERMTEFINSYRDYVNVLADIQTSLGKIITNLHQSTRELKIVTAGHQGVSNFCAAVDKLDKLLTDELIDKLRRVIKDDKLENS